MDTRPKWIRFPEAMRITGMSRQALRHLINEGQIESKKVGKSRYLLRKSVEELKGDPPQARPYRINTDSLSITGSTSIFAKV